MKGVFFKSQVHQFYTSKTQAICYSQNLKGMTFRKLQKLISNTATGNVLWKKKFHHEVKGLQVCNFITKRLQHRCFLVKFSKFLKTTYFEKHLRTTATVISRQAHIFYLFIWFVLYLMSITVPSKTHSAPYPRYYSEYRWQQQKLFMTKWAPFLTSTASQNKNTLCIRLKKTN